MESCKDWTELKVFQWIQEHLHTAHRYYRLNGFAKRFESKYLCVATSYF